MSHPAIEQDRLPPSIDGDDLPTYDDLAAQEGPNSRFGRWRGWIEKRAAERYMAITPEERARRKERGWGNEEMDALDADLDMPSTPTTAALSIQTKGLRLSTTLSEPPPTAVPSPPLPPLPPTSTALRPTHLKLHHFGSRFLPHATAPIRCLLPLQDERLLLVGHDEGLSVLDMYPQEWDERGGIEMKGPEDATVRAIWEGEGVFQMSILEQDASASGVVLLLVGPEPASPTAKDAEAQRSVRMYSLASLVSLAKWAVANRGANPLNLSTTQQTTPSSKKHRPSGSIARGLKSLIPPSSSSNASSTSTSFPESSKQQYQPLLTPAASYSTTTTLGAASSSNPNSNSKRQYKHASFSSSATAFSSGSAAAPRPPPRANSDESSWELLDAAASLPIRWARDYVPLAGAGKSATSRLAGASVVCFVLWTREGEGSRSSSYGAGKGGGGREQKFLAVATKGGILLYETPVGERAFRFVKEFYTPLQPKSMCFFQQSVHDVARSPLDVNRAGHRRSGSNSNSPSPHAARINNTPNGRSASLRPPGTTHYGTQLSIFVVFEKEKKAGWIRIADSAVGEMEMFDVGGDALPSNPYGHASIPPYITVGAYGSSLSLASPHARTASSVAGTSPASVRRRNVSHSHMDHGHGHDGGSAKWILPVRCELPPADGGMGVGRSVYVLTRGATSHVVPCPLPSAFGSGAAAGGSSSASINGG
ncbi:hypothetical protein B0H19DRAFT_1234524, partial [Mycena capillaripes]